ncbi:MAG: hypothetical protein LBU60_02065 [Clostridiales bacterium]|jgi:amino acid transporter|nr:hypothetical protein [Clostridiales bacterium]
MIDTNLSQQDLKSKMTDLQYQSARDYLINLVPCLSMCIFLIPISALTPLLFEGDDVYIIIHLALMFAYALIVLVGMSFVRTRIYASLFTDFKVGAKFFKFETVSYIVCCTLPIVILFVEYLVSLYGDIEQLKIAPWILLKVGVGIYAMFVSWVLVGISYEKYRKKYIKEIKLRRKLKAYGIIDSIYNTRKFKGSRLANLIDLKENELRLSMTALANTIRCVFIVVTLIPFVFLGIFSSFWTALLMHAIGSFIVYTTCMAKLNRITEYAHKQNLKLFGLGDFAYIACVVLAIGVALLRQFFYSNENSDFLESPLFLTLEIVLSVAILMVGFIYAKRAKGMHKRCLKARQNYNESQDSDIIFNDSISI